MWRFIVERIIQGFVALIAIALITFVFGRVIGSPLDLMMPDDATPQEWETAEKRLGLNKPMIAQLGSFMGEMIRGDLGTSIRVRRPVAQMIAERFPYTLRLVPPTIIFAIVLAVPLGIISAMNRGRLLDRLATLAATLGIAVPNFWLGIVLIYIFAVWLGWLPAAGMGGPLSYVLPVITLGVAALASLSRMLRSNILEVMGADFVRTARSKGLRERVVFSRHVLRNAMIPTFTLVGLLTAHLVTGAIVIETVFGWPGVGRLTYEAVIYRDYPVLQGIIIVMAGIGTLSNLLVDIPYAYIDPRIRYD